MTVSDAERERENTAMFKQLLGHVIGQLIETAHKTKVRDETIQEIISAEMLALAATMHEGDDALFLARARRALALVRTGTIEQ